MQLPTELHAESACCSGTYWQTRRVASEFRGNWQTMEPASRAVLLILVQWSRDTSIFIKLGYEMYWKEKPISSEFSKRIQSSGKLPSVLYAIFNIIPVLTMSRDTTINDIFKC